jgi:hypothetical protein
LPKAHRNADRRACGALTFVEGQSTVFVNGKLWAVENDGNTHTAGGLIPSFHGVFIEGKPVIVHTPDLAHVDGLEHVATEDETAEGSGDVFAYGG